MNFLVFENENEIYDLIVVGGGPTGSTAARYAKKNGVSRVLVIEENPSVGSPVQCAGLLSVAALKETDMEPDSSFVLNSVKGAKVYPPNKKAFWVVGKETKAYVVSRKMFDRKIAEKAANAGVECLMKAKVIGLKDAFFPDSEESDLKAGKTGLKAEESDLKTGKLNFKAVEIMHAGMKKTFYSKIVIAADGVRSEVSKMAGLKPCERVLSGIQIETDYKSEDSEFVEMFVGQEAPGFFAWSIPISESVSRIGLAIDSKRFKKIANEKFNNFENSENSENFENNKDVFAIDFLNRLLENPVIQEKRSLGCFDFVVGGIPIGPMKKTYSAGFMVVGDAAGQCKPISGGGIYTGAVAAKIAAKVAANAVLENDFSEKKMAEYEKLWKKELGRELELGMKIHEYRMKLTDEEMNRIFDELNDPDISRLITEYGDMDHPSVLIQKLMLSKHSLKMIKLFGTVVKTLF